MKIRTVFQVSILFTLIIVIGVTVSYPGVDDFLSTSRFWNGLADVNKNMNTTRLRDLADLSEYYFDWSNSTLFFIGPGQPFTYEDVSLVEAYLWRGGRVFVADDFGSGNMLLEGLKLDVRFSDQLLLDPLYRQENSSFPIIFNNSYGLNLVLNYATVLVNVSKGKILGWSSRFSYVVEDVQASDKIVSRSFPVYVMFDVGDGELHLLSDSSPFINRMLIEGNNQLFLKQVNNGVMFLDESHIKETRLTMIKNTLFYSYELLQLSYIQVSLILVIAIIIYKLDLSDNEYLEEKDEVDEVMKRHPDWDRKLIEWLHQIRQKNKTKIN